MSGRGIRQDCPSCGRLYCAHQESTALAAARREGWAQAIEALRAQGPGMTGWWAAADYLTDRAAALTEEGS